MPICVEICCSHSTLRDKKEQGITFHSLFYLMVLINCHTISKSVHEDYKDNIYENLNDLEYSTKYYKHGRIQHPFRIPDKIQHPFRRMDKKPNPFRRMDKKEDKNKVVKIKPRITTQILQQKLRTQAATKPHPVKVYLHDLRKKIQSDTATEINTLQMYTAEVINNLWDKLQNKIEQKIHGHKTKHTKPKQKMVTTNTQATKMMVKKPVSHNDHFHYNKKKKKRDIFWRSKSSTTESAVTKAIALSLLPYKVLTYTTNRYTTASKPMKSSSFFYFTDETPSQTTPSVYSNTKEYNYDHNDNDTKITTYSPYTYKVEDNILEEKTTSDETYFPGTAEIEALLDEIKARAIQMIAEQNPGLNDLVTNSVTETTYSIDPMLTHVEVQRPMLVSTLVSMNLDFDKTDPVIDKPIAMNETIANNNNDIHKIAQRSLKSDIYTMAEDFDNELQEEIRELVRMVKAKIHSDRNRKATMFDNYYTNLYTKRNVEPAQTSKYFGTTTAELENKLHRFRQRTKAKSTTRTIPIIEDEFDMLTLFEQMLTKDHENNKMTQMTTGYPFKRQVRNIKVNKRNSETLADLSLKAAIQKEKEGEGMPDDTEVNAEELPEQSAATEVSTTNEGPEDDGSFEGLSNKLSYSQYVKGYKHYLEFTQNDLNDKNFSNLVRYQAHRHHNVDDIGKFILEKIPEVPKYKIKNKRFFFDGIDSENMGESTTADPSWFQKHFYLFMDTGTNKKFHTSQTVALKPADPNSTETTRPEKKLRNTEMLDEKKIDLDELMKDLYKQTSLKEGEEYAQTKSLWNAIYPDKENENNRLQIRDTDRSIVEKLINLVKRNKTKRAKTTASSPYDINHMYDAPERFKRNFKKHKKEQKKEHKKEFKTTVQVTKESSIKEKDKAYVDVNIVPNPTAVVKLKEDGKDNRFVNMFKKLSLHRHQKKKIKEKKTHNKRDLKRRPRFNPIKTLKNMFKSNEMYKNLFDESDLGLVTTKINAFKVVNYDKVPTPEEMSKMIPNITGNDDNDSTDMEPTNKYDKYSNVPKTDKYGDITKYDKYGDVPTDYSNSNDQATGYPGRFIPKITMQIGKKTDDILKVKVSKVKNSEDYFEMKNPDDSFDKTKYPDDVFKKSKYPDTDTFKILKADKHNLFKQQHTVKNNMRPSPAPILSINTPPYVKSFAITSPNFDNVILKTTNEHRTPKPQMHKEYFNNNNNGLRKRHPTEDVSVTESMFREYSINNYQETKGKFKNYTTYPDYFNDLMLWHNDILNMDRVSRDPSNDLFKLKHLDILEAPDIGNMQKEVLRIKEYLSSLDDNEYKSNVAHDKKETFELKDEEREAVRAMATDTKGNIHKKSMKSLTNYDFHKFYTKTCKTGKEPTSSSTAAKEGPSRTTTPETEEEEEEPVQDDATIETTILAYDHDDGAKVRGGNADVNKRMKVTKNAKPSTKSRVRHNSTITKLTTITHPQQYFTTPVPMTKEDFDNFLKQNNLDVQSVTTPLTDLWKFEDKWFFQKAGSSIKESKEKTKSDKMKPQNSNKDKPGTTPASKNKNDASIDYNYIDYNLFSKAKFSPEYDTQYINQFDGFEDDFEDRNVKNYFKSRSPRKFDEGKNRSKSKRNIIKKKTRKSVLNDDNVDITIIDLDDTTETAGNQITAAKLEKADLLEDVETKFQIEKPARYSFGKKTKQKKVNPKEMNSNVQTMHNGLLFDRKKAPMETAMTSKSFQPDENPQFTGIFNTESHELYDEFPTPFEKFGKQSLNFKDVWQKLNKLKPDNQPKSVQISSQSVRFDVVYHDLMSTEATKVAKNKKVDNLTHTALFLNETDVPQDKEKGNDSEITQIVKVSRVIEALENATNTPDIHIDLPTYTPDTNATKFEDLEKKHDENYLKFISGIALLQVLSKCGLNKSDTDINEFGGVDYGTHGGVGKRSNANGVFRDSTGMMNENERTTPMSARFERAANKDKPIKMTPKPSVRWIMNATITSTKRRSRFNFLPYIQEKLFKLVGKKDKSTVEKAVTKAIAKMKKSKKPLIGRNKSTINTETTVNIVPKKAYKTSTTNKASTASTSTTKLAKKVVEGLIDYDFGDFSQLSTMKVDEETLISDYLQSLEEKRQAHEVNTTTMEPVIIGGKLEKRDIQSQDAFTVRNVAALEVVVDMMKNGIHSEPMTSTFFVQNSPVSYPCRYTQDMITRTPTNSVQVHIAVPYASLIKDKRSQDPLTIRRVFSAKMYTPVDIEYQIHSYEDNNEFTSAPQSVSNCEISPGIYLLVENPNKGSFSLKPIKKTINVRQIGPSKLDEILSTEGIDKIGTTVSPKLGRVTLSKDFISAVNKQLLDFDSKGTTVNLNDHSKHIVNIRDVEEKSKKTKEKSATYCKKQKKKSIDWDIIRRIFGNDRVCSCHLKSNKTMCAACAASDAVMSELIFEFENMAKYMSDHCTEIQTFFWMNPTGGRKLRDTVHKIDRSLHDYFKRVKGKCRGRTCQTFSTYIDKRKAEPNKANVTTAKDFSDDLEDLADDLANVNEYEMIGDNVFKDKSEKALQALNNCISEKAMEKRSVKRKNDKIDNVYSLDKINVNIICKPDTTEFDYNLYGTISSTVSTLLDYDDDEVKTKKPRKMFKNLFKKIKSKKHDKTEAKNIKKLVKSRKRDVKYQLESPLIADTGGSFWHDYLTKASTKKIEISDMSPQIYMNIIQAEEKSKNDKSVKDKLLQVKDNIFVEITNAYKHYINKETTEHSQPFSENTEVHHTEKESLSDILTTVKPTSKTFTKLTDTDKNTIESIERTLQEISKVTAMHHEESTTSPTTKLHMKKLLKKTKKPKKSKKNKKAKHKLKSSTKKQKKSKFMISFTGIDDIVDDNDMTKSLSDDITTAKCNAKSLDNDLFPSMDSSKTVRNFSVSVDDQTTKSNGLLSKFKKTFGFGDSLRGDSDTSSTTEVVLYEKDDMRPSRSLDENEVFPQITDEPVRNVISEQTSTTSTNPTILIIEDYDDSSELVFTIDNIDSNSIKDNVDVPVTDAYDPLYKDENFNNDDLKNLLASILKYEKDKLNNDWKRYVDPRLVTMEDEMPDLEASYFSVHTTTHPTRTTSKPSKKEFASGDYCIMKGLRNLELPDPFAVNTFTTTPKTSTTKRKIHFMIVPDSEVIKQAGAEGRVVEVYSRSIKQRNALSTRKRIGKKHKIKVQPAPSAMTILMNSTILVPSLGTNFTTNSPLTDVPVTIEAESNNTVTTSCSTISSTKEAKEQIVVANDNTRLAKKTTSKEACDPATSLCICDIHATFNHVKELHKTLNKKDFERYARNVSCFKYKHTPKYFRVNISIKNNRYTDITKRSYMVTPKQSMKWDWIRNKRSIKTHKGKKSYDYVYNDYYDQNDDEYVSEGDGEDLKANDQRLYTIHKGDDDGNTKTKMYKKGKVTVNVKMDHTTKYDENIELKLKETEQINYIDKDLESQLVEDGFESFYKDSDEVYRLRKRKKRTAVDMRELMIGLRSLPPLRPALNEMYVMQGDDITLECTPPESYLRKDKSRQNFVWETDRSDMLKHDNLVVNDNVVTVKNVGAKNAGNYTCSKGSLVHRIVQLTVLALPGFHIVFIPMYATNQACTYDDLKAMQQLGPVMSKGCTCQDHESIKIEEPLCLRDRLSESSQIKATAILSSCPRPDLSCSAQCRRDLQCSLALLCAANALPLTNVPVIISKNGAIKTLQPTQKSHQSAIVTHTLRKKELNGHQEFHRLASSMSPGNVDIVVSCPAGHYLLIKQKICAVCPTNTYSSEGENVCVSCATCSSSGPGSARCRLDLSRLRRYDWWCQISLCMVVGVVSGVGVGVVACLSLRRKSGQSEGQELREPRKVAGDIQCSMSRLRSSPRARPITPSRVILARFFRPSIETMASSKATDSQETKFEQWKEKNIPPPLPPIDFDT